MTTHAKPPAKPYQIEGIDKLRTNPRFLLADDAGLGKSRQMIDAANALKAKRILILTPAVGRGSWKLQLQEWDDMQRQVVIWPTKDLTIPTKGPCAVICTFEWLSRKGCPEKLIAALTANGADPFTVAVADEGQALKTPSASRTKAVYGKRLDLTGAVFGASPFTHRWIASATFTPLSVSELYTHLRALFPDLLAKLFGGKVPTHWDFEERYCLLYETRFGREIIGNNQVTIPELRDAIRPYFLMRRKTDVLQDLPPILTIPLPLETGFNQDNYAHGLTDEELDAMTDAQVTALLTQMENDPNKKGPRAALGEAKMKAVLPWITDFLRDNPYKKLLIFAHHRPVIEGLRDALNTLMPAVIYGGVSPSQKEAAVARFQTDPNCRVFIGNNHAAGTAITLTAAHTVVLVEPDPSPDQNYQIISRAHRVGQTEPVSAYIAYDAAVPLERRRIAVIRRRAEDNYHLFGTETPGVLKHA